MLKLVSATAQELPPVAKAMIRLLRAPLEVQSVVLNSIASLTVNKRVSSYYCLIPIYLFYKYLSEPRGVTRDTTTTASYAAGQTWS